jgi:hypothetical protein
VEELSFGLGCQRFWQAIEVYLIGRERFQAGVGSDGVVEVDVTSDGRSGFAYASGERYFR